MKNMISLSIMKKKKNKTMGKNLGILIISQLFTNSIYQLKYNSNKDMDVLWSIILMFTGIGLLISLGLFIFKTGRRN